MLRYFVIRLLQSVITLIAITVVTFALFFMVPASPGQVMCGKNCDANSVRQIEERLGLADPKLTQYGKFVAGIVAGRDYGKGELAVHCPAPCLGYSFRGGEPVTAILARTLPVTIGIVAGAAVFWLLIGVGLGMVSALRRGSLFDRAAIGTSLVGASMQIYFFGLVLLIVVVYTAKLMDFPRYTPLTEDPLAWLRGMILPWVTLGFLNAAIYARLSRAQMLETLSEDFVRTARAKGLPQRSVYLRHAFRAAVTPIVTIAGLDVGTALGGAVITETVFSLPGLGRTAVAAVNDLNLPVVMATVLVAAVFIVVANVVVDVLYAVIDPRVRLR